MLPFTWTAGSLPVCTSWLGLEPARTSVVWVPRNGCELRCDAVSKKISTGWLISFLSHGGAFSFPPFVQSLVRPHGFTPGAEHTHGHTFFVCRFPRPPFDPHRQQQSFGSLARSIFRVFRVRRYRAGNEKIRHLRVSESVQEKRKKSNKKWFAIDAGLPWPNKRWKLLFQNEKNPTLVGSAR